MQSKAKGIDKDHQICLTRRCRWSGVGVQCQCRSGEWSLMSRPGGRREFFSSANQLSSAGGAKGGVGRGRGGKGDCRTGAMTPSPTYLWSRGAMGSGVRSQTVVRRGRYSSSSSNYWERGRRSIDGVRGVISTEGTKVLQRTSLRKTGREAHSHGGKPGGTGRPVQLLPQISREERQREGERGRARKQERNDV
jgi:hypothetical protein